MATYEQIAVWVRRTYGKSVKTCWIAHVKDIHGLIPHREVPRVEPCPPSKRPLIESAFRHFGMLPAN
jgi:hypothetical protein